MESAPNRTPALAPGYRLGRYELINVIAKRSQEILWGARQVGKASQQYAIKTQQPERPTNPRLRTLLQHHTRIAQAIIHPNILQVLEGGEQDGIPYYVMEWVDGCTAEQLARAIDLEGHHMPLSAVLRVIADICAALHAAHEQTDEQGAPMGIVHCEVCPRNILLGFDGTARLVDFCIGKVRVHLARETSNPCPEGDPAYRAPELVRAEPFDRRSDLWSVGAVLYELLGSRPPYVGANDRDTVRLLTSGRPPPRLGDRVPKLLEAIVRRCLTLEPGARYQTAAEVRNALTTAMRELDLQPGHKDVVACLRTYVPRDAGPEPSAPEASSGPPPITRRPPAPDENAQFLRGVPLEVSEEKPTAVMYLGDAAPDFDPDDATVISAAPQFEPPPTVRRPVPAQPAEPARPKVVRPQSSDPVISVGASAPAQRSPSFRIAEAKPKASAEPVLQKEPTPAADSKTEAQPTAAVAIEPSAETAIEKQSTAEPPVPPAPEPDTRTEAESTQETSIEAQPRVEPLQVERPEAVPVPALSPPQEAYAIQESQASALTNLDAGEDDEALTGLRRRRSRMRWVVGAVLVVVIAFGVFAAKTLRDKQSVTTPTSESSVAPRPSATASAVPSAVTSIGVPPLSSSVAPSLSAPPTTTGRTTPRVRRERSATTASSASAAPPASAAPSAQPAPAASPDPMDESGL